MANYTKAQRVQALHLYKTEGPGPAAKQTGIPARTIVRWAKDAGLSYDTAKKAAAPQTEKTLTQYRADTALRLYTEANRLLDQLYEPNVQKKAVTVSQGKDNPAEVQVAVVELDKPTYTDQKHIMTSAAIALDKAQLLAGEATDRAGGIPAKEVVAVIDKVIGTIADNDEQRAQATDAVITQLRAVS